jgi:hypothetical protein
VQVKFRGEWGFEPSPVSEVEEGVMILIAMRRRFPSFQLVLGLAVLLGATFSPALGDGVALRDYFLRGDVDQNGRISISDAVGVLRHLFLGDAAAVECRDAADLDDNGRIQLSDAIHVLEYSFFDGPPPASPFPGCGNDAEPDRLECAVSRSCVPPAGSIVLYGVPYDAVDTQVVFVVDRSESMQDSGELESARREIASALCFLPEESSFAIVISDTGVVKFPSSGHAAAAVPEMVAVATTFLDGIRGGSGSCIRSGFLTALDFVTTSVSARNVVIYIGDGGGTCQGAAESVYLRMTLEAVTAANDGRAAIHTIGVLLAAGDDLHVGFLQDLAAQNSGTFRRIP